jgi:hypothetical protein
MSRDARSEIAGAAGDEDVLIRRHTCW